jgi:hypothetical protein
MSVRAYPINSSSAATTKPGVNDYDLLRFPTEFLEEGVVSGFAVSQYSGGANMSVDIAAGIALIEITNTNVAHGKTYKTWFENTATVTKAITTADPTNPRKDRVVLRIDVSTNPDANAANIAVIEVLAGTPAGSPSAPAEPANAITLAIIDIPASDTTISTGQITDSRTYVQMDSAVLADIARESKITAIHNGGPFYAVATGSSNAYAVTITTNATAYTAGQRFTFKANFTNTASATLNVNSLGAKTIKKNDGATNLSAGDIVNGQIVEVEYDGTNLQMLSPVGTPPTTSYYDKTVAITPTSSSALSNPTSATVYDTTLYTIPANDLVSGVKYQFVASGVLTTGTNSTFNITIKVGGVTFAVMTTGTIGTGLSNVPFVVHGEIYGTAAAGGSVSVRVNGFLICGNNSSVILATPTDDAQNVATNATAAIQLAAHFGSSNASNATTLKTSHVRKSSSSAF